jgi:predicted transcriptional regulator of viral defense system
LVALSPDVGGKVDLPGVQEVARRQWGVVTLAQLVAAGLSDRGVEEWIRTKRIVRLHRGVYAYGHDRLRTQGYWLAAVLTCGPGARLSHTSVAALWEMRQSGGGLIDVTVPSRPGRVRRKGIRVHRSGRLTPEEVTQIDGIPVTTVARTLLDLADVLDHRALRRAVTEAEYRNVFDLTALDAVVESNPGRRTKKLMHAAMGEKQHRTRSPLEDRFLRFVDRYGVEEPDSGVWVQGYDIDFLWRSANLAVELDGLNAHGTREAVRRDRKRDRILWRAGIRTLRLTDDALDEPGEVLADLAQAGVRVASWPRAWSYPSPRRARISSARAM